MELTYLVQGADGKQYGPVTIEQLTGWIREGRLLAQAQVKRSDMEHWAAAGDFVELQSLLATVPDVKPVTATKAPTLMAAPLAMAHMKSGATWFYWIAGLSLINSIASFVGSSWRFIVGLGLTQVFDALASRMGGTGRAVVLGLDLLAASVFILLGYFANRGQTWAFLFGLALFGLDGLLMLAFQEWLGVAFHVLVLYWLFRGLQACRRLKETS